jgi:hypothetical protein
VLRHEVKDHGHTQFGNAARGSDQRPIGQAGSWVLDPSAISKARSYSRTN